MSFTLAEQLASRMRAFNISIITLERVAGLKPHTVRNILRGKSKNPSAVNLQAIADALMCTVKDLLETPEFAQEKGPSETIEELLNKKHLTYPAPTLLSKIEKVVNVILKKKNKVMSVENYLSCIKEVYLRSLQKDPTKVNVKFVEWYVGVYGDIPVTYG